MSHERGETSAAPNDARLLARSVGLNVAGQAGGFAIAFFSSILLARTLGPSDRGLLAIMVVISTVALALAGAGLQVAMQYYAGRRETSQRSLLGNTLGYGVVLFVVFVPLFLLLHGPISDAFAHGRGGLVWVLAAVLIPLTFLDYSTAGQLCGRLQFGLWNVLLIASRLTTLVCVVVLVAVLGLGVAGGVLATAAGSVVVITVTVVHLLRREGRPRLDLRLFRNSVRYGAKAQVGSFFQFLNFRLDVLVLTLFVSLTDIGHYAIAQTLAELGAYLGIAFQISVLPIIARSETDRESDATSSTAIRHHAVIAFGVMILNAIFAPLVLLYGYGGAYRPALVPLLILLPGIWFLGSGSLVAGDLRGRGRPGLASIMMGGAALVTVALDLVLIPRYGINGAAIASTLAYTTFGVASVIALSRVSRIPLRQLAVPTRADLAAYPRALRRLRKRSEGHGVDVVRPHQPLVVGE